MIFHEMKTYIHGNESFYLVIINIIRCLKKYIQDKRSLFMENFIYMDNAATTPVNEQVLEAMIPYFNKNFGNPSGVYRQGYVSKKAIENAREQVANLIGAYKDEIFFTSGGSESDNWAIRGIINALGRSKGHLITTKIEHHAILNTCKDIEKQGYNTTYLPVDKYGLIEPHTLEEMIQADTVLITVMAANNEIGTIEPIKELGEIAKNAGILFHTDAVQAVGHIPIDVKEMNVDMLSLSGHKLGAPKGVGALYIKRGIQIQPFIYGGGQEKHLRAGTENVAGIVGLGVASEVAQKRLYENAKTLKMLRDKLIVGLLEIPFSKLNGHSTKRLPSNCNISFDFVEGQSVLSFLDEKGICASGGSACSSGSTSPSHVLLAIGATRDEAKGTIRFTLGANNTQEDVDYVINNMGAIIQSLREMSPVYNQLISTK